MQGAPILQIHSPKLWPSAWKGTCLACCCCPHSSHSSFHIYLQTLPDFFLALNGAGIYSLSLLLLSILLFLLCLLSLSWTFSPTSHDNNSDVWSWLTPWTCATGQSTRDTGVKFVERTGFDGSVTLTEEKAKGIVVRDTNPGIWVEGIRNIKWIEKSVTEWTLETSPHIQQHPVYTISVSTLLHLEL